MASLHLAQQILDIIYPVGSVYLSWNSTDPKNLFGGTWVRLKGGFVYGCQESSGTGNGTGTATNSHTLTINEIPSHQHEFPDRTIVWDANTGYNTDIVQDGSYDNKIVQFRPWGTKVGATGGGKGHSHNIPYIAVFAWRRTA